MAGDVCGGGQGLVANQQAQDQQRQDGVHGHHDSALPDAYRALQPAVRVGGISVRAQSSVRNLGVIMDSTMDMHDQIQGVKCAMFYYLRTISNIRRFLDRHTCDKAVLSMVMSRVDYCNSLLVDESAVALRGLDL